MLRGGTLRDHPHLRRLPTPLKRLGVRGFGESGDYRGLYAKHGLDAAGIAGSVRKFLNR